MDHLWSPWRMSYIQSPKSKNGCVFCEALEKEDGQKNLIVYRGEYSFVILNRYPYTSGHIMILPFIHRPNLIDLDAPTRAEMMELTAKGTDVLQKQYNPQGFNLGANLGEAAGAGIEEHIHIHIVPRWTGDTNFMSSLGQTRVLPEALEDTYRRIKEIW